AISVCRTGVGGRRRALRPQCGDKVLGRQRKDAFFVLNIKKLQQLYCLKDNFIEIYLLKYLPNINKISIKQSLVQ
ncbi:hypothetical protein, partial [Pseudomonas viridiflava]|uniref:hypothetical protein n=1 Tax=Pseudomonas viridiflava TaxID=33069 RepID=UPI001981185A